MASPARRLLPPYQPPCPCPPLSTTPEEPREPPPPRAPRKKEAPPEQRARHQTSTARPEPSATSTHTSWLSYFTSPIPGLPMQDTWRRCRTWNGARRCGTTTNICWNRPRKCCREDTILSLPGRIRTGRTVWPSPFWRYVGSESVCLSPERACTGRRQCGWRSTPPWSGTSPQWRFVTCRRGRLVQEVWVNLVALGRTAGGCFCESASHLVPLHLIVGGIQRMVTWLLRSMIRSHSFITAMALAGPGERTSLRLRSIAGVD